MLGSACHGVNDRFSARAFAPACRNPAWDAQRRHAPKRRQSLRPFNGGILNRHPIRIGAQLHQKIQMDIARLERGFHGVAQEIRPRRRRQRRGFPATRGITLYLTAAPGPKA